ncbi:MAG: ferritin family protein [Deltaproteobacteria bacterium]|nr:ferritin family protein [Deltaproteobacteria bacterium]
MSFENLNDVLDFAIEREIEAAEFYRSLAVEESMSGTREMFKEFAEVEKSHQTMLEDLKAGKVGEKLAGYKLKWIPDMKRSDYVVDMEYRKGMPYNEILLIAMKREEKALQLYNELLKEAEPEAVKRVFKILCQEEAKHKLALETLYDDYMAEMGD